MSPIPVLLLGFVLGVRHAADPDHVVAVAAIAARTRRVWPATWLGLVWGLGHSLTLFGVGAAIIAFNLVIPPRIGLALEFLVALALVTVGVLNLRHEHPERELDGPRLPAARAFSVGIVHGLAGSAAVALLVLATVRDTALAAAYLLVFAAGTLVGMALVTTAFAAPLAHVTRDRPQVGRMVRFGTGSLAIGLGAWLVYHIGWHDGLFLATPTWSPH